MEILLFEIYFLFNSRLCAEKLSVNRKTAENDRKGVGILSASRKDTCLAAPGDYR